MNRTAFSCLLRDYAVVGQLGLKAGRKSQIFVNGALWTIAGQETVNAKTSLSKIFYFRKWINFTYKVVRPTIDHILLLINVLYFILSKKSSVELVSNCRFKGPLKTKLKDLFYKVLVAQFPALSTECQNISGFIGKVIWSGNRIAKSRATIQQ